MWIKNISSDKFLFRIEDWGNDFKRIMPGETYPESVPIDYITVFIGMTDKVELSGYNDEEWAILYRTDPSSYRVKGRDTNEAESPTLILSETELSGRAGDTFVVALFSDSMNITWQVEEGDSDNYAIRLDPPSIIDPTEEELEENPNRGSTHLCFYRLVIDTSFGFESDGVIRILAENEGLYTGVTISIHLEERVELPTLEIASELTMRSGQVCTITMQTNAENVTVEFIEGDSRFFPSYAVYPPEQQGYITWTVWRLEIRSKNCSGAYGVFRVTAELNGYTVSSDVTINLTESPYILFPESEYTLKAGATITVTIQSNIEDDLLAEIESDNPERFNYTLYPPGQYGYITWKVWRLEVNTTPGDETQATFKVYSGNYSDTFTLYLTKTYYINGLNSRYEIDAGETLTLPVKTNMYNLVLKGTSDSLIQRFTCLAEKDDYHEEDDAWTVTINTTRGAELDIKFTVDDPSNLVYGFDSFTVHLNATSVD